MASAHGLYASPSGPAVAARRALGFVALCTVFAAALEYRALQLLDRATAGDPAAVAAFNSNNTYKGIVYVALLGATLLTIITFIRWLSRAYRNVEPLTGAAPRFRTSSAIWGWFVPILALWRPKQIVNDVWRSGGVERQPWFVTGWWIVFLLSGTVAIRSTSSTLTERHAEQLGLAATILSAVAAVLAIRVVGAATQRQESRRKSLAVDQGRQRAELIRQSREGAWSTGGDPARH